MSSKSWMLGAGVALAVLVGCGGAPGGMPQSRALAARGDTSNYKVLYRFLGEPDGAFPVASLIDVHGTLYGTTQLGGANREGTVFSMTTSGTENTVYSFKQAPDGNQPVASLIDVKGTLYGTTITGGHGHWGIAFSMTTRGVEKVLTRFGVGGIYGLHPAAPLIEAGGTFYGTTEKGGAYKCYAYNSGCGTLFSMTPSGSGRVLHNFGHYTMEDGYFPRAVLLDVGGTLYGTTYTDFGYRSGVVFSIAEAGGSYTKLHKFRGGSDGAHPAAGLIDVGGTLYGTTSAGGTNNLGTVFSITTGGSQQVIYSFAGGTDGSSPTAGLIDVGGRLYGTTSAGGSAACHNGAGCGTVYSISTSGAETVLRRFAGGSDGAQPNAELLDVGGVLYGTTTYGGSHAKPCGKLGCGTVFALTP